MNRLQLIVLTVALSIISITQSIGQNDFSPVQKQQISFLDGNWRVMYKMVEGEKFYNIKRETVYGGDPMIDTNTINSFLIDNEIKKFGVRFQDSYGNIEPKLNELIGRWSLEKVNGDIDIVVKNAYFKGSPPMRYTLRSVNQNNLRVYDHANGNVIVMKRVY